MRVIQSLPFLVCCCLIFGCAQHMPAPPSREGAALVLDNHGGYSHAGRRVALRSDGSYTDTRYTDAIGDERMRRGHYNFDAEKTYLVLSPTSGEAERLCRVDYGGQQYWVLDQDRKLVTDAADNWFRQISLRVDAK